MNLRIGQGQHKVSLRLTKNMDKTKQMNEWIGGIPKEHGVNPKEFSMTKAGTIWEK